MTNASTEEDASEYSNDDDICFGKWKGEDNAPEGASPTAKAAVM